jgi:hypothetical protein
LNEFAFRFNNRKVDNLFGMKRMALAGNLPYAQLIEEGASMPFVAIIHNRLTV